MQLFLLTHSAVITSFKKGFDTATYILTRKMEKVNVLPVKIFCDLFEF